MEVVSLLLVLNYNYLKHLPCKTEQLLFQDEAAAKKFRAISEAYEVLGNIQLKKMYDKGWFHSQGTF